MVNSELVNEDLFIALFKVNLDSKREIILKTWTNIIKIFVSLPFPILARESLPFGYKKFIAKRLHKQKIYNNTIENDENLPDLRNP